MACLEPAETVRLVFSLTFLPFKQCGDDFQVSQRRVGAAADADLVDWGAFEFTYSFNVVGAVGQRDQRLNLGEVNL